MYAPASDQFVYIVGEVHERCYRSDHSIPQKKPEGGFHCKRGMLHGRGASTLFSKPPNPSKSFIQLLVFPILILRSIHSSPTPKQRFLFNERFMAARHELWLILTEGLHMFS